MSPRSYLERLREKPDHEKKRFAFWSSLGFTVVLFAFWVASFSISTGPSNIFASKTLQNTTAPAQSLIAGVGSFFGDIFDYFITPKTIQYTEIEVVPGK